MRENIKRDFAQRSDEELLTLLLRSEDKARRILDSITLGSLSDAHRQELGLTPKAYERLQASIELGRRIQETRAEFKTLNLIKGSNDAIEFCKRHFARLISDCMKEEFHVVSLTTKNQVITSHQISVGTLDSSLVHPREVFRPAIKDSASSIILAHNHPSGDPTPSREDFAVTNRLTEVGKTLGIDVLDHIVMATKDCVSIRELE